MSDARCWIARYTGIEENIAILHDERPTRIRIIRIIDGITSDNEISSLNDERTDACERECVIHPTVIDREIALHREYISIAIDGEFFESCDRPDRKSCIVAWIGREMDRCRGISCRDDIGIGSRRTETLDS